MAPHFEAVRGSSPSAVAEQCPDSRQPPSLRFQHEVTRSNHEMTIECMPARDFALSVSSQVTRPIVDSSAIYAGETWVARDGILAARSVNVRLWRRLYFYVFNYVEVVEGRRTIAEGHHAL